MQAQAAKYTAIDENLRRYQAKLPRIFEMAEKRPDESTQCEDAERSPEARIREEMDDILGEKVAGAGKGSPWIEERARV